MEDLDTVISESLKGVEDAWREQRNGTPADEGTSDVAAVEDSADDTQQDGEATVGEPEGADEPVSTKKKWSDPDIDWDGLEQMSFEDRASLPPPIQKKLAAADRHFQEQNQRLLALQRQYQEALTKTQDGKQSVAPESDQGPPPPPGQEATQQDYDNWVGQLADWKANKAVQAKFQEVEELKASVAQMRHAEREAYTVKQLDRISKMDGYSPEVADVMAQLASTHPHWQASLESEDGINDLFYVARQRVGAQRSQSEQVNLQTTAATRAVSKPASKGATTRVKQDLDASSPGEMMEKLAKSGQYGPDIARMFG